MAGVAAKFIPRELLIHTPDGATRPLALERERYTLGRSSANELCYPEDAGLSRQHLAIEKDGDTWVVRDLGSKNGTFVNGVRITSPFPLGKNDRVTAGHIALDFGENSLPPASDTHRHLHRRPYSHRFRFHHGSHQPQRRTQPGEGD